MKKRYLAAMFLLLALGTAACGKSEKKAETTTAPAAQETTAAPTEAPTTAAPTEAPTTAAPTTAAPETKEETKAAENVTKAPGSLGSRNQGRPIGGGSTEQKKRNEAVKIEDIFQGLNELNFEFSSGVGGWATSLHLGEDGSFAGLYTDSDMGVTGEGYPDGTLYYCEFMGNFTDPVKIDDYTYLIRRENIEYTEVPGKEEILGGMRYIYSEAYGLEGDGLFELYLPGKPVKDLSEEYLSWVWSQVDEETTELPFVGLYNVSEEEGFSSYDPNEAWGDEEYDSMYIAMVRSAAEEAEELERSINKDALSQHELNEKAAELYKVWDDVLNQLWAALKAVRSEEDMKALTVEQRAWIKEKEADIKKEAEVWEGGSMKPFIESTTAARWTKDRVYYLLDLLEP